MNLGHGVSRLDRVLIASGSVHYQSLNHIKFSLLFIAITKVVFLS
jgi:hypothetical protein